MRLMKLVLIALMAVAMAGPVAQAALKKPNTPEKKGGDKGQAKETTVTGAVAEVKDAKGATGYAITGDDGSNYTLKGHESDLALLKDKRAVVTGKVTEKNGSKVLKVESVKEAPAKTT
jgi:hypothetical protein